MKPIKRRLPIMRCNPNNAMTSGGTKGTLHKSPLYLSCYFLF